MNAWSGLTDYLIADMASLSSTGSSGRRLGGCAFSRTENLLATATKPPINAVALSVSIPAIRSEEHTSELQSQLRISYAVFRLNKKNTLDLQRTKVPDDTAPNSYPELR